MVYTPKMLSSLVDAKLRMTLVDLLRVTPAEIDVEAAAQALAAPPPVPAEPP